MRDDLHRPEDAWQALWISFQRALRAGTQTSTGKPASIATLRSYGETNDQFHRFLMEHNYSTNPVEVQKKQIEEFLIELRERKAEKTGERIKPATVRCRFSALRKFFNWLEEEEEIDRSPMDRMRGPKVDEDPPEVLSDDELQAFLNACKGREFEDRRDAALIRLMMDTGLRRGGIVSMTVEDTNVDKQVARVHTKGDRFLMVPFGAKTAAALDRYLRIRPSHYYAKLVTEGPDGEPGHPLWLSQKGYLRGDGVHHLIQRRAKMANIRINLEGKTGVHPHMFRHTFAHLWKKAGGSEEDLMQIGGWRDRKVMARYGASAAEARAREAHRRLSLGDRL
ncbi:MAG: tyrosine-type recombinase/integrase [Candidatus Dormibacteraceae bacterium]